MATLNLFFFKAAIAAAASDTLPALPASAAGDFLAFIDYSCIILASGGRAAARRGAQASVSTHSLDALIALLFTEGGPGASHTIASATCS